MHLCPEREEVHWALKALGTSNCRGQRQFPWLHRIAHALLCWQGLSTDTSQFVHHRMGDFLRVEDLQDADLLTFLREKNFGEQTFSLASRFPAVAEMRFIAGDRPPSPRCSQCVYSERDAVCI